MKRVFIIIALALAALYAGDYVSVRYRILKSRSPFGTLNIQRYYAVKKKNGEPDFYFEQPQTQTCVHSLFPHFGYSPCWYLSRRTVQRINL
jgi:hypothetical protein